MGTGCTQDAMMHAYAEMAKYQMLLLYLGVAFAPRPASGPHSVAHLLAHLKEALRPFRGLNLRGLSTEACVRAPQAGRLAARLLHALAPCSTLLHRPRVLSRVGSRRSHLPDGLCALCCLSLLRQGKGSCTHSCHCKCIAPGGDCGHLESRDRRAHV